MAKCHACGTTFDDDTAEEIFERGGMDCPNCGEPL